MAQIALYTAIAIQVMVALYVLVRIKKDSKKNREFYDNAFMAYQREYQCKSSRAIHEELLKFYHCQQLVTNDNKK